MSSQLSSGSERHGLTPFGASRKRKDRDRCDAHNPHTATKAEPASPAPRQLPGAGGNRLLAGYLAHEFLTRGTLFGERWAETGQPVKQQPKQPAPPETEPGKPPRAYAEVAYLLKTDGAHLPGVVNPTELARWLHM